MQSKEQQVFDAIKTNFNTDKRRVKFISYLIVSRLKITNCALSEWSRAIAQPTQPSHLGYSHGRVAHQPRSAHSPETLQKWQSRTTLNERV